MSSTSTIDLRSDTVTRPSAAMRRAMADAEVGDDVYGEDPTVERLQAEVAALLGKQAGLFVTSGTQGNLLAICTAAGRGDEIVIGDTGHSFLYEVGGPAAIAGVPTHALPVREDGTLDPERIAAAVRPREIHHARTRLVVLENTKDGRVLPLAYLDEVGELLGRIGVPGHLDGARLFNAAAELGVAPERLCRCFETVTVCLSKGLGAPVGSVLCGSRERIEAARRWRKMLGGGLRQVGVLAAAGLVALGHRDSLIEDHRLAGRLAQALAALAPELLRVERCATNMLFVSSSSDVSVAADLQTRLSARGIVWPAAWSQQGRSWTRLVTHRDLPADTVERVTAALGEVFGGLS
ncbi:MAG: low-specificity L-threonine aldolase [Acidobacteria bacterium]|nr:MAG: low-specificity L-threonine aldolase [Acidobacteriota bacterium]